MRGIKTEKIPVILAKAIFKACLVVRSELRAEMRAMDSAMWKFLGKVSVKWKLQSGTVDMTLILVIFATAGAAITRRAMHRI